MNDVSGACISAPPLSGAYWRAVRGLSEPFELMKFTLVYDGDLPAGSGKRAVYASKIRNVLHDQLFDLWNSHVILRQIERTARVHEDETHVLRASIIAPTLSEYECPVPPVPTGFVDLCAPMPVRGDNSALMFKPLVRRSLYLCCYIDILFLRHEEPFELFRDGGDLDNRLKCFFDGLKVPDKDQLNNGEAPTSSPLYCLMEDDRMVSGFSIRTGRLLGSGEKKPHQVRLSADVTINVMRVREENLCLVGG